MFLSRVIQTTTAMLKAPQQVAYSCLCT